MAYRYSCIRQHHHGAYDLKYAAPPVKRRKLSVSVGATSGRRDPFSVIQSTLPASELKTFVHLAGRRPAATAVGALDDWSER
jgi:hypothetical protein